MVWCLVYYCDLICLGYFEFFKSFKGYGMIFVFDLVIVILLYLVELGVGGLLEKVGVVLFYYV